MAYLLGAPPSALSYSNMSSRYFLASSWACSFTMNLEQDKTAVAHLGGI